MPIWKFKSCPRCRGDILIEKENEGWCEHCLQCGYMHYITSRTHLYRQSNPEDRERVTARVLRR